MEINERIWQRETKIVDKNNSYHDEDFSAASGRITKNFKELCNISSDFFRALDDTNIAGMYVSKEKVNSILLQQSWLAIEQENGQLLLRVDNNQKDDSIPLRLCTQNGLKDLELGQPYGFGLPDRDNYEDDFGAGELIRFLLDFPIKKFLNTVYVSVKHIYYEQQDNQYGFFEIPEEFYKDGGVCSLQNFLNIIKEKPEEEKNNYVIDNWWIRTDYFNSKNEIVPYFYNIFISTHVDGLQFAREIVNVAAMKDILYKKETKNQPLNLYYYYYQNFCFIEYNNQTPTFFHNSCSNIYSDINSIKVVKETFNPQVFSNQSNIRFQKIRKPVVKSFRTSVYLGGDYTKNLSDFQDGHGEIIGNGNLFIGKYCNSDQVLEEYNNGEKLISNSNLFVIFKIWTPEEIEMLMNDMICCWSADKLNIEQKELFFHGEINNPKIENKIRIPIIENGYYITGQHNFGQNAYNCLPDNILDLEKGLDPTTKYSIDKILPSPNFSNKKDLDVKVQENYNDIFELEKNISLWGIRERENGKFLVSDTFPYSYYRNNQINPFIGMIRTKISKPTIIKTDNGIEIRNLKFNFEDVVKKSISEEDYHLAEVSVNTFSLTDSSAATSITIDSQESPQGIVENKELDYGFYRGEVASWCENNYEAITFKINFSYKFRIGFQDGDSINIFLQDEQGIRTEQKQLVYHSEQQTYPNIYFNLKAYDENKNKKIYKIYYISNSGKCILYSSPKSKDISINDNNITIKLEVAKIE